MIRVGVAGLWHETNTYSARPTTLREFEAFELLEGEAVFTHHRGIGSVIGGMLDGAGDLTLVPLVSAAAWPSGPVDGRALEEILARIETALERARALDALLLNLHGAMVGVGTDDVEAELLRRVRAVAGELPIAAVLDLHGLPSPELIARCDVVVAYETYPHVDMRERGREAAALLAAALHGRPLRSAVAKVPLLSSPLAQATDEAPLRDLHALARGHVTGAVARVSLLPGFPYSDVARAGFSVVATADADAIDEARRVASSMATEVERRREEFAVECEDPATAVERALGSSRRPVILADVADNIGGGSPGDGTVLLRELIGQRAAGAVVMIADPDVAAAAAEAGAGRILDAEVGGKTDDRHGEPVAVHGRVVRVSDGRYSTTGYWMTGQTFSMGTTAVIEADGVTLVVSERAVPPFHVEQLTSVGVDPAQASIVVVKGAVAWRAAYAGIAGDVIEVDTPGICPVDPAVLERSVPPMRYDPLEAPVPAESP